MRGAARPARGRGRRGAERAVRAEGAAVSAGADIVREARRGVSEDKG